MSSIPPKEFEMKTYSSSSQPEKPIDPLTQHGMTHASTKKITEQAAGAEILKKRPTESSEIQGRVDSTQLTIKDHAYLEKFNEIVNLMIDLLKNFPSDLYMSFKEAATLANVKLGARYAVKGIIKTGKGVGKGIISIGKGIVWLGEKTGKGFVLLEWAMGTGIFQNGYDFYKKIIKPKNRINELNNNENDVIKKLNIEKNNKTLFIGTSKTDESNRNEIDDNIKHLEEQQAKIIDERIVLKESLDSNKAITKTNLVVSVVTLGGYVGKAASFVSEMAPWTPPGINIATSTFSTIRTIHSLYNQYNSYKLMKNEINLCREIIENSEKKILELENKTESNSITKEISDLKTQKIICNQRMISLQLKIKNEWKRELISNLVSLALGALGMGLGITALVGAPWLVVIVLMGCSGGGYVLKISIVTYNYFAPPDRVDEDKKVKFRTDHRVTHYLIDEKQLTKYLKQLFEKKVNKSDKITDDQKNLANRGLEFILAKKLHIYNNKKEIDPHRLKNIICTKNGKIDTNSEIFKRVFKWVNGDLDENTLSTVLQDNPLYREDHSTLLSNE